MRRLLQCAVVGGGVCLFGAAEVRAQAAAESAPPLRVSGYVTASYTWSNHPAGGTIVGRFYDRTQNGFMANAAKLVVEKPIDPGRVSAGAKLDALFGQNAEVTGFTGNRLALGEEGDLLQAYAVLHVPTGEGRFVEFRAGKMATLIGIEVMEDVANPNLSIGNQFVFLENFTNTGVRVDATFGAKLDAQLAVFNGWDLVRDNNSAKSVMARVGFRPTTATTIALVGYSGPEQEAAGNRRRGAELTAIRKLGTRVTLMLEGDYGEEDGLLTDGTKAVWYGVGGWITVDLLRQASVAVRGDWVRDRNGVRTSGVFGFPTNSGLTFGSATATLNVKVLPSVLLRPEVRADFADLPVYDARRSQVSFAFGSSYVF